MALMLTTLSGAGCLGPGSPRACPDVARSAARRREGPHSRCRSGGLVSASLRAPRSVRHTRDVGGGGPVPSMATLAYTRLHRLRLQAPEAGRRVESAA